MGSFLKSRSGLGLFCLYKGAVLYMGDLERDPNLENRPG